MRLPISNDEFMAVTESLAKQTEQKILDQLGSLVSDGILVIEQGPMLLAQSTSTNKIEMVQDIKIVLRDREHIQKLENKIESQKIEIEDLKKVLRNI